MQIRISDIFFASHAIFFFLPHFGISDLKSLQYKDQRSAQIE